MNRKERELLALRDQVGSRDKQLVEANDRSLTLERELADLSDKHVDVQRDLDKAKETLDALQADKESAKKRLDDLKARFERAEARSRELSEELGNINAANAAETRGAEAAQRGAARCGRGAPASRRRSSSSATTKRCCRRSARRTADELAELKEEHSVALAAAREEAEQQRHALSAQLRAEAERTLEQRTGRAARQARGGDLAGAAAHEAELPSTREASAEARVGAGEHARQPAAEACGELKSAADRHADELKSATEHRRAQERNRAPPAGHWAGSAARWPRARRGSSCLQDQLEEAESARADGLAQARALGSERDAKVEQISQLKAQLEQALARAGPRSRSSSGRAPRSRSG